MEQPSRLSGLWSCLVGAVLFGALAVALEWGYRWSRFVGMQPDECPNSTGNGGPFADTVWELIIPGLALLWFTFVLVEQVLPATWRGRNPLNFLARALFAVLFTATFGCIFPTGLVLSCH
ncbi:hypothetical protein ACIA8K_39505 [Catenuloplanes sp. NPDC051500]|uniref:hypothetical protein n=1 Tax=Catenuloplanes sp. NPDC051500 TaxID=3363959 RepID=UPI00379320ED